jgi:transposase
MSPIKYFTHIRLESDSRSLRNFLVQYAERYGIKPAARMFNTTPKTVKKWLKRKANGSSEWMIDQRSLSKPRKSRITEEQKLQVIRLKKKHPSWGSMRIKKTYDLSISDKAIRKIWKEAGLA